MTSQSESGWILSPEFPCISMKIFEDTYELSIAPDYFQSLPSRKRIDIYKKELDLAKWVQHHVTCHEIEMVAAISFGEIYTNLSSASDIISPREFERISEDIGAEIIDPELVRAKRHQLIRIDNDYPFLGSALVRGVETRVLVINKIDNHFISICLQNFPFRVVLPETHTDERMDLSSICNYGDLLLLRDGAVKPDDRRVYCEYYFDNIAENFVYHKIALDTMKLGWRGDGLAAVNFPDPNNPPEVEPYDDAVTEKNIKEFDLPENKANQLRAFMEQFYEDQQQQFDPREVLEINYLSHDQTLALGERQFGNEFQELLEDVFQRPWSFVDDGWVEQPLDSANSIIGYVCGGYVYFDKNSPDYQYWASGAMYA